MQYSVTIFKLEIAKLPLHDIYVQENSDSQNIFRGINL
jgi:hypothetical protein